ncbi:natural product precursor [Chitinophaga dinghuensis]|uniref:Natural product n=1 Tax=Chitinophaga dinghuensis TaxID=1539050 RepID=A0A327VR91_9BACT|nr:class I lanthipeptide [Chitinophaga dinghuensis]RAJ76599.1 natural product precursor [Chitinophaga dinghuensis]
MESQNNQGKGLPKLSLNKETISRLNDEQMKNVIGGLVDADTSCGEGSCQSQQGASSCDKNSCNC